MTRTDVVASSRPQIAGAAPMSRRSSSAWRRLSVLPVALLLAVALLLPTTAFAAAGATGYSQTPPTPSTGASPSAGTSPSKEASKPTGAKPSTVPFPEKSEKGSTLPRTGFDLRWSVAIGLLLMGAGFSIVTVQRRRRRNAGDL
jgi:LPXTG-motif cell wall-anchored protein